MEKKTYITPDTHVVVIPATTLLSASLTNVPYDPNGSTGEALSPFQELDMDPDVREILF